ncbi:hypothetical protein LSTR_LSTR015846 [Laodelphax striatellus]|uniref:XPG N-terminal domain-containing protein n=1 Tax=Laodelphax striatellus TaxID=195883 RepID=A0A482X034_LAOST|nr:hypothetical protein LSTR_LSTR015846 [Laodelphax striatellus]
MGVRGLTTFISNNDGYMEGYELHDTFVIIDGNSLKCQLFILYGVKECIAFGGDYDRYAHHVKEFFQMLSKCNVKCVVIFDGGMEEKKVKTILKRSNDKIAEIEQVTPASSSTPVVFPILLGKVFREVLSEIGVPMVQCDFEADQEIAALGLKYNCPIISNDSDFFISGVQYIPIPTIEQKIYVSKYASNQFFMPCKIFRIENLLNRHPGLNISLLPLLSALSGNDYMDVSLFRKFYLQLDIGDRYPACLRVARVIEWLSRVGRLDSALHKVSTT